MKHYLVLFISLCILLIYSCDTSKFTETPDKKFIGLWKYETGNIYDGIQVQIEKTDGKEFKGKIIKLNNHKLVQLFLDTNMIIIDNIERNSNFEFEITENKIAKELFGLYKIETTTKYRAQFVDDNTIGLSPEKSTIEPKDSKIRLVRIRQ